MNKQKVLVSPSSFGQCGKEPYEFLEKNGYEVIKNPYGRKLTEEEVIELGKDCIGIIAGVETLNKKVLDKLSKLKCISRVGVGMDSIDVEYAKKKGIKVLNTPNGPTRAVAELTVALTMNLLRKVHIANENLKKGLWKKEIGNLIFNKTVGILGFGRIGKETAKLFLGLGAKVIFYDIYPDYQFANKLGILFVDFDMLLKKSDIITIHIPPKKDNKSVISINELQKIKSSSYIVNVSRGGVVDENALFESLVKNKIAGAAIDVFKKEPYKGKLQELDNIILTPHLGSYACEAKLKMEIDAVNNFLTYNSTI